MNKKNSYLTDYSNVEVVAQISITIASISLKS